MGLVLALPALFGGLAVDDLAHIARMRPLPGWEAPTHPLLSLFSFMQPGPINDALIRDGVLPWTAHPQVQATLLRPLSAATHLLDHALWPDSPVLQHAHSLAWWFLAALVVGLLFRRALGVGLAAGLAALLYAVDDSHAMPIAWIANRNALLCIALGAGSVLAHLEWRRRGQPALLAASVALALLGLLAGEATLGALAYIVAWELTDPDRRLVRLVPHTLLVLVWRGIYSHLGYGAKHSGLYIDPANEPAAFVLALGERGPILMLAQVLGLPVDLWLMMPRAAQLGLTAAGIVASAGVAWLFLPLLREDRRARWLALGMVGALVPLCAAFPMDRLLVFSGLGFAGLLGLAVERQASKPVLALLLLAGPMSALAMPVRCGAATSVLRSIMTDPIQDMPAPSPDDRFLFLNANEFATFYVTLLPGVEGTTAPRSLGLLAPMFRDVTVTRRDDHTLVIEVDQGWLLATGERIARDATPFVVGETVERPGFTAQVEALTEDGRPLRTAFTFDEPIDHPDHVWICWVEGKATACTPPAPGETRVLPATLPTP